MRPTAVPTQRPNPQFERARVSLGDFNRTVRGCVVDDDDLEVSTPGLRCRASSCAPMYGSALRTGMTTENKLRQAALQRAGSRGRRDIRCAVPPQQTADPGMRFSRQPEHELTASRAGGPEVERDRDAAADCRSETSGPGPWAHPQATPAATTHASTGPRMWRKTWTSVCWSTACARSRCERPPRRRRRPPGRARRGSARAAVRPRRR